MITTFRIGVDDVTLTKAGLTTGSVGSILVGACMVQTLAIPERI
jgi:hypothetical protein